jgi:DNA-binding beta-propeller fold protein YncE
VVTNNSFTGAHGIFANQNETNVFVTNIGGAQLYALNATTGAQIGSPTATASATPHNITINEAGNKLFVTHSGAMATSVTTYTVSGSTLTAGNTITAGTNPFGVTYYKREVR